MNIYSTIAVTPSVKRWVKATNTWTKGKTKIRGYMHIHGFTSKLLMPVKLHVIGPFPTIMARVHCMAVCLLLPSACIRLYVCVYMCVCACMLHSLQVLLVIALIDTHPGTRGLKINVLGTCGQYTAIGVTLCALWCLALYGELLKKPCNFVFIYGPGLTQTLLLKVVNTTKKAIYLSIHPFAFTSGTCAWSQLPSHNSQSNKVTVCLWNGNMIQWHAELSATNAKWIRLCLSSSPYSLFIVPPTGSVVTGVSYSHRNTRKSDKGVLFIAVTILWWVRWLACSWIKYL